MTADAAVRDEIAEIVDRETRAWNTQDVDLLLSIFHPDMVWPWPSREDAHDPVEWRLVMGRFDADRWRAAYAELFAEWQLVHNRRNTVKIEISEQGDGAFAVVDIDTLWRRRDRADEMSWKGRVCKVYSRVGEDWKLTMHTGALTYPEAVDQTDRATTNLATAAAAVRWADTWARAWPAADVPAIEGLYAPDAVFFSHPFREPQRPGDYAAWAFSDQAEAECRFGEPVVSGDRAAIDWWGVVRSHDGSLETLAGTSLLRFDADGLVVEQRDAWAAQPGRTELPSWASEHSLERARRAAPPRSG